MENVAVQLPIDQIAAPKRARRGERSERLPGEPRKVAYVYLAVPLLIYAAFTIVPLVQSFDISFYKWDGITPGSWVGLANYKSFFADPVIRGSYLHTLILIVFYSFIPTAIGLLLAALLSRMRIHGLTVFRTLLFLPAILTDVVLAVTWTWIYDPTGPLNTFLGSVGLGFLRHPWLGDFHLALPAVGVFGAW